MARKGLQPLTAASAGFATFLAAMVALHVRNLHSWPRHVSSFVYESWGWLWAIGILALGLGLAALAYAAFLLLPRTPEAQWAVASLGVASCAVLLMALFPTDITDYPSTASGYVHDFAAVTAVTFQCATMFFAMLAARQDPAWRHATGESNGWPWLASALGLVWGLGDLTPWWGFAAFVQRILAAVMVGWLLAVAWRLRVELVAERQAAPIATPERAR